MSWILVIWLWGNTGVAVVPTPFRSLAECQQAGEAWDKPMGEVIRPHYNCLPHPGDAR